MQLNNDATRTFPQTQRHLRKQTTISHKNHQENTETGNASNVEGSCVEFVRPSQIYAIDSSRVSPPINATLLERIAPIDFGPAVCCIYFSMFFWVKG